MDFLLKISFLVSILGIILLLFYVNIKDISETEISKIDQSSLNVKITGEVVKAKYSDKVSTITIKQSCNIDVVAFDNLSGTGIKKGDTIEVVGKKEKQDDGYVIYADDVKIK